MIALDTNVLVRILVRDDEQQARAALAVLDPASGTQKIPVLLLNSVLLETVWVLESVYGSTARDIGAALETLLHIPGVSAETSGLHQALAWYRKGMDFADALHLASASAHCEALLSFDSAFIRKAKGKTNCRVYSPG